MELILQLYLLPYNPLRPVICFDERPCFLIGDRIKGLEMKKGEVAKENYAYTKHGSCCVLAAIEPLTGKRFAHIRPQRRRVEFAEFMKDLADLYPDAEKIIVVLDNLNTHNFSSFFHTFDAQTAAKLMDRFEFVFTPKSASWLNMVEIEFSALSRQCLNRRISTITELEREVLAYFKEREKKQIRIEWQFSRDDARKVMIKHYVKVNPKNEKL